MDENYKLRIEYADVDSLKPYSKNARQHGEKDTDAIVESIREFGFKDPIGIGEDGTIIEGHGRLIAAKKLGMKTVPIIRLSDLTEEERKAYALAHNKTAELSGWAFDILESELKSISEIDMSKFGFDMEAVGEEEAEIREDDFVAKPQKNPTTKPGDVFRLGGHFLICGDSTKEETVKTLLNGQQADMYLTDPPYNVDYVGKTKDALKIENDKKADGEFRQFLVDAFKAADGRLKPGGAFYIWHADSEGFNFRGACREVGWQIRECIIWNKNTFVLGRQDYQWKHEPCLYGWKDGAAHYFINDRTKSTVFEGIDKPIEDMKKEELKELIEKLLEEYQTTVIEEKKPSRSEDHPTMKPIALLARQIKNSSRKGEIVLDTFGGSGSTLIACEQLGRRCYMAELDPRYCDVIIQRWETFTGKKAERLNDENEMEKQD